nr:ANR family transcriptional regulator [Providencia sneebia]
MAFINNDSPLYFRAARDAIRLEQAGKYFEAATAWLQAHRLARTRNNQIWSERRSDFCMKQLKREMYKGTSNEQSTWRCHRKALGQWSEKSRRYRL